MTTFDRMLKFMQEKLTKPVEKKLNEDSLDPEHVSSFNVPPKGKTDQLIQLCDSMLAAMSEAGVEDIKWFEDEFSRINGITESKKTAMAKESTDDGQCALRGNCKT